MEKRQTRRTMAQTMSELRTQGEGDDKRIEKRAKRDTAAKPCARRDAVADKEEQKPERAVYGQ